MGQKIVQNFYNEYKLFGILKIYDNHQTWVEYQYDIKDEEIKKEVFLQECEKMYKQK